MEAKAVESILNALEDVLPKAGGYYTARRIRALLKNDYACKHLDLSDFEAALKAPCAFLKQYNIVRGKNKTQEIVVRHAQATVSSWDLRVLFATHFAGERAQFTSQYMDDDPYALAALAKYITNTSWQDMDVLGIRACKVERALIDWAMEYKLMDRHGQLRFLTIENLLYKLHMRDLPGDILFARKEAIARLLDVIPNAVSSNQLKQLYCGQGKKRDDEAFMKQYGKWEPHTTKVTQYETYLHFERAVVRWLIDTQQFAVERFIVDCTLLKGGDKQDGDELEQSKTKRKKKRRKKSNTLRQQQQQDGESEAHFGPRAISLTAINFMGHLLAQESGLSKRGSLGSLLQQAASLEEELLFEIKHL